MRPNQFSFCGKGISLLVLIGIFGFGAVEAQTATSSRQNMAGEIQMSSTGDVKAVEAACGGFIEFAPATRNLEIVGGEQEQEQRVYSEGDYVFINAGAGQGLRRGQEFSVIRPRGRFSSKFSRKRGSLGVYTEELGRLRLIDVRDRTSVALVTSSCEALLLGDLLRDVQLPPQIPIAANRSEAVLDRFAQPSGKQEGRIVLARDGRELVSRSNVVFIDLGAEDGIKIGDQLTIFRPAGTGNITRFRDKEVVVARSGGFESDRFRGGDFSNQAQRVKRPTSTGIYNPTVTTPGVKSRRPPVPRKIVGEVVVVSVEQRTAKAVITRVAQEVHTGDFVEVQ